MPPFVADEAASEKEVRSSAAPRMPDKAAMHNDHGITLFKKGDCGAALLDFNRELAEDPNNCLF